MKELMASPSLLPEGRSGELCKKILQYLGSNKIYLDKRLSLAKFSSVVGTNTTYLSNAVNQVFHCNVKTLINWYRVQYAKTVLSKKMYSLKDIPFVCGFSSKSTFYSAFRKYEGITPYQYMHKNKDDCDTIIDKDIA